MRDILLLKGGDRVYIDYSKLWKLLIDKNMTKTDLCEITGISSRVLAKLSKNETVTTDTVARICEALECDVSDIMECVSEDEMSLYSCYKKFGKAEDQNEFIKTVRFTSNGQKYTVYVSQQRANGGTCIKCCEDGAIRWEEHNRVGHLTAPPISRVLIKPIREDEEIVIVVVKGKPGCIAGLDENRFVSSKNTLKSKNDVYVMSEAAFKAFKLK